MHGPTLVILPAWCAGAAALAVIVGASVLIGGWILGIDRLKSVLPGLVAMKANTAACFVLCGAALWASRSTPERPWVRAGATAAAALAVLVGTLTLAEYAGRMLVGLDELLSRDVLPPDSRAHPGRMSPLTALGFVMLGVAIITLDCRPRLFRMGQRLAVGSGFIAFLVVVAYAYSIRVDLTGILFQSPTEMALHTAGLFVLLSIGVTAARVGRGATGIFAQATAGGAVARALLPLAIVGPVVAGAVRLAGERAGYYGTEVGLAIMAVANVVMFSLTVWWTAVHLHKTDRQRHHAEADVRRSNQELEARVRARTAELAASEARYRRLIAESVVAFVVGRAGSIRFANAAAARLLSYESESELIGLPSAERIAPEFRDEVRTRVEARLRGEPGEPMVQLEVLRKDGSRVWVEGTSRIVDWDGEPSTLVAFTDVSERRRREALEQEAAALRTVAELANATGHEINNPLMVISGSIQLMLRAKVPAPPEMKRHLDRCEEAVHRITAMVSHMKRISRLERLDMPGGISALDLRRSSADEG